MPEWIALAVVTQPHGVRGQVKLKSLTQPADGFSTYKHLCLADGTPIALKIEGVAQGQFIASIHGIADRNDAERWRGKQIGVAQAALPALKNDREFYYSELVGMSVVDAAGAACGVITSVENYGAGDILEIAHEGSNDLYAFTNANFPRIDRDVRVIEFHKPEILMVEKPRKSSLTEE